MRDGYGSAEIAAEELARFKHYVRFVSQDAAKNRQRFYLLSWQRMLDGDTALVCSWGRLGTHGRSRTIIYPDRAHLQAKLVRLIKRRLTHGYQVTAWHEPRQERSPGTLRRSRICTDSSRQ